MIERALVCGLGSIGKRHLRLLREALPAADIRVLRHQAGADVPPEANGGYHRIEDAAAFAPQIAIIASPAPFHMETATALAECGAHLLIEKPIAADTDGVSGLLSLTDARGLHVQCGYNLRFLETLQAFRNAVRGGEVGRILSVRCEIGQYLPRWRPDSDYRETVSAKRALGGGALLELSHELDLLRWVFGDVTAVGGWVGQVGGFDIDVEDCAHLTLKFECGANAHLAMDFLRRDTTRTCTAIGTESTLRWDAVAGEVSMFEPEQNAWRVLSAAKPDRDDTYRAQIAHFLTAIRTGNCDGTAASGSDGLAVLQLVDAARVAAVNHGQFTKPRSGCSA